MKDNYVLPKLKYKDTGTGIRIMRIKAKKDRKIEIMSKEEEDYKNIQNNESYRKTIEKQIVIPNYTLYV